MSAETGGERITITALAQRVGVSRKRVTSAIERGEIPMSCLAESSNGRVITNAEEAERALRAAMADKPARAPKPPTEMPEGIDFEDPDTWPRDLDGLRVVREWWVARQAKRKDDLAAAELVRSDDVRREAFGAARALRDGLLRIPDRLAEDFAAEFGAKPADVRARLQEEIERHLMEMHSTLAARVTCLQEGQWPEV